MKPNRSRFTTVVILLTTVMPLLLSAQLNDDFSDGNFSDNPEWTGDADHFIVNPDFQLKLNSSGSGTSFLSAFVEKEGLNEWRIWVNLAFSPSDNNNAKIYLVSDLSDLSEPLNGYYLKLGESGSADAIELYRQSGTADFLVCRGSDGLLSAPFSVRIRVVRTQAGKWNLYCDPAGGDNFLLQAAGEDPVWLDYRYFGVVCKYTSSNAGNFYFDGVYAGALLYDDIKPMLFDIETAGGQQLLLSFSESMNGNSVAETGHYAADQDMGSPVRAECEAGDDSRVRLSFSKPFIPGTIYNLTVSGVADLAGNLLETVTLPFALFGNGSFSVVINEIMADPDPPNRLPAFEYLELYNRNELPVKLDNWKLSLGGSFKELETIILASDAYLILTGEEAAPYFESYGNVMALPGFSLLNTGTTIVLKDGHNAIIHAVSFADDWYQNEIKEKGGWSLEMADPGNPCAGASNWRASDDLTGGTPGERNSINSPNPDQAAPGVSRITLVDASSIMVVFSEPMDSLTISDPGSYTAGQELGHPVAVRLTQPDYCSVFLEFNGTFVEGVVYSLVIQGGFSDCAGNTFSADVNTRFALPLDIEHNDIAINEVLYDPGINGADFVEIYNRSEKVVDLKNLWLASRDATTGEPEAVAETCPGGRLMFPGEFVLLTSDLEAVRSAYFSPSPEAFVGMKSFPSYPNGEGAVVLFTPDMQVVDEFNYSDDLHFSLLNSTDGVSLERINYNQPAGDPSNWHSASANVGYATPGYRNSQFMQTGEFNDEITVSPEVFSPDNDGFDDILSIGCNFQEPGNMVTIRIFDSNGRLAGVPVKNEPAGTTNVYYWDGTNDDRQKASIGIYIIHIEVFNASGKVRHHKKAAVLAGMR